MIVSILEIGIQKDPCFRILTEVEVDEMLCLVGYV